MLRRSALVVLGLLAALAAEPIRTTGRGLTKPLPQQVSDQEFWRVVSQFSEPSGSFHSENLVSNEIRFQTVLPSLVQSTVPGRAYVGVGSEQNFTYMTAIRPGFAFILDLRRGNLDLHLIYKALFEMSADRAEFVSRMFSKARPAGLTAESTPDQIFDAFARVPSSQTLYDRNLQAIYARLATTHGFALSNGDRDGIQFVYSSWFAGGPALTYQRTDRGGFGMGGFPTYAELMTARDGNGVQRSYLATEANFRFLKDLQTRNRVIPVVGNFGGPKALRAIGAYLKEYEQTVSAYYLSNVEQYLRQDGIWGTWCASAATLPIDARSMFIRSQSGGGGFTLSVAPMMSQLAPCAVRVSPRG